LALRSLTRPTPRRPASSCATPRVPRAP